MEAWGQAVRTNAPELNIKAGLIRAGNQLRRKITKSLEEQ